MVTSKENTTTSNKDFGIKIEKMIADGKGEAFFDSKDRRTYVAHYGQIYQITHYDERYKPIRRDTVKKKDFEYNYRHHI